jgi:TonB-dependent SusC/RagA subfamily outer membrane receptor
MVARNDCSPNEKIMRKLLFFGLLCGGLLSLGCSAGKSVADGSTGRAKTQKRSERIGDSAVEVESDRTGQSLADYLRRMPGVQVRGDQVYVRNSASIASSDQPLFVIDGNPVGDDFAAIAAFLNPNDIDYVEVLKDAVSMSEYGARGANGVIRIYLKKD